MSLTAQDTLILQPDAICGEDAIIWELSNQTGEFGPTEDNNYGNSKSFLAHEWTWNGDPGRRKSLLNFDFSLIPPGSIVLGAYLDLNGFPDSPDNGHSSLSGSNEAVLKRITSPWSESTVTWNTQPTTTDVNQVFLSESASVGQNYLDINITDICQDMIDNPLEGGGIMLSMIEQAYYRAMIFASSDHPDPAKHPRLTIIYIPSSPTESVIFEPLPDTTICIGDSVNYVVNAPCASYYWSNGSVSPEITLGDSGTYWVEVMTSGGSYIDTFHVATIDCGDSTEIPEVEPPYIAPPVLVLPNVFTPNIDGVNDVFVPLISKGIIGLETQILNRWGQVVYETSDLSISWDGKTQSGAELTDGVYFWIIHFSASDGSTGTMHGKLHLLR
jgi:gliding motility-associated-like protein